MSPIHEVIMLIGFRIKRYMMHKPQGIRLLPFPFPNPSKQDMASL